ncbi:MAG: hypothetical protein U1F43_03950 [Myxococcota bacterium]
MSYEDDDGDGDERGRGKLVAVASFFTPHEAELARTKLVSEGILAFVWDAATIAADPLLAVALRGVKVAVPERDAPRARAILGPLAEVFGGMARPVFRVRGTRGTRGLFIGLLLGLVIAFALGGVLPGPWRWVAGAALAMLGLAIGERQRADTCSGCMHPVRLASAPGADRCPHCNAALRGTINHMNDRLAAEEALDEDPPELDEANAANALHDSTTDDADDTEEGRR